MKKCIIIGAGDFTLPKSIEKSDFIIAADGGYDHAVKGGIVPHLFIGDMDSLTATLPENLKKKTFPERKDYTDMQLSYMEGKKQGYRDFEIYGGMGGRSDHTFANISLLLKIAEDGCNASMISSGEVYTVIKDSSIDISGKNDNYISVFAIGGVANGVSIKGLDYEVENVILTPSFPLGVSNRFTDKEAKISVQNGALLIIYQI